MKRIAIAILVCASLAISAAFVIFVSRRVFNAHEQHRRQVAEGQQSSADISRLSPRDVSSIIVHDRYGREILAKVSDTETKATFLSAINQMVPWRPNHPRFERRHHVVLSLADGKKFEFSMCIKSPPDPTVYVYGVRTEGNTTYYLSRSKSETLKHWLESTLNKKQTPEPQQSPAR